MPAGEIDNLFATPLGQDAGTGSHDDDVKAGTSGSAFDPAELNPSEVNACERCDQHWARCTCGSP